MIRLTESLCWRKMRACPLRKLNPSSFHLEMSLVYAKNHVFPLPCPVPLRNISEEQKVYASPFPGLPLLLLIHHLKS